MNLSQRSKLSLCQFLSLFERDDLVLLLGKYGLETNRLEGFERFRYILPGVLKDLVFQASASQLEGVVQELARTWYSMRTNVSPKYRFDARWTDLLLCIELDGYSRDGDKIGTDVDRFVPIEPIFESADAVDDDLTKEIHRCGLPDADGIIQALDNSAAAFRNSDFNGCLNNARVALQTLATSIARGRLALHHARFDEAKWGQVIAYLKATDFITQQQEKVLAGVYGLVSPGSHKPIGFNEEEFARLGRGLVVTISYFLVKQFNALDPV